MAKKIYDIKPPMEEKIVPIVKARTAEFVAIKFEDKKSPENTDFVLPENIAEKKFSNEKVFENKKKLSIKGVLITGIGISVVVFLGYLYFNLQKAEIEIYPKTELLSANVKITADKSVTQVDLENKKIPLELFEIEKDLWQDFPATGNTQNSGKASGTIIIYNKLNPVSSFTLKAGTHFLSDSGKYFIMPERVTIPAGTLKNGKLNPGSISVKVVAEEAGKDHNIEASKFSIPKLVGTNYYYSVYAESTNSMTGGFLSDVKQVTEDDLLNAKKELSKKVLSEAEKSLREKISSDYVLFDNAISNTVTETFSPIKIGTVVENFNYQVKVKSIALAFKRQDIEKFAKDNINSQIFEKSILEKSFKLDFIPESVDLTANNMILSLDFSTKVYAPINTDDFIPLIMQKNKIEIKDVITSRLVDRVEKINIKFWPFWTKKAPTNKDKIKINLMFE